MGLRVVHAGQDISAYVDEFSLDIESALAQGPGVGAGGVSGQTQAIFNARLGPITKAIAAGGVPSGTDLVRKGEVVIYDAAGEAIFGGYVAVMEDATDGRINVQTKITCEDYWSALDQTIVNEVYIGRTDGYIINDLITTYAPGIDSSGVAPSANYTFEKLFLRARTLRDALQRVADTTGFLIWVGPDKILHYVAANSAETSPFGLSSSPDSMATYPHGFVSYKQDDTSIINRVYFYGGKNPSPDFAQDLRVQANGANKTFSLAYFPHDASDGKIHVIKNGVELTMYSIFDTDPAHALISAGGTADVLINLDAETLTFDTAPATGLTQLDCVYRYQIPLVVVLNNNQSQLKYGAIYEGKIVDQNVYDVNAALQRCRVLLAQQADGLVSYSLYAWKAGLQAGMIVHVIDSVRQIDDSFLIQKVTLIPLGNGHFQYQLDMGAWEFSAIDVLMQAARSNTQPDDETEEDTEVIQAEEIVEAISSVTVTITHDTRTSGVYYARTSPAGDGHDAYSGFSTITT